MKKLGLLLMHGRKDPNEDLDDWGEPGPIFPVEWLHVTYMSTFSVLFEGKNYPFDLSQTFFEDLFFYDDMYYGDWEVGYYDKNDMIPFDDTKTLQFIRFCNKTIDELITELRYEDAADAFGREDLDAKIISDLRLWDLGAGWEYLRNLAKEDVEFYLKTVKN